MHVGQAIGPYVVDEAIGHGGMSTVYRARHVNLDREVALKILAAASTPDPDFLARFQTEARTAAALNHPNIVPIYDTGVADGVPFIAMRLVRGQTLARIIENHRGPLPFERSLVFLKQIASALDYAHGQGIVHRDLKPANILVEDPDVVFLSDFGIARMTKAERLTQVGYIAGTPEYMAPEQALGEPIDHRSDLYALGVMAFELLSGELPFQADSPVAVAVAHVQQAAPQLTGVAPNVAQAVAKMLAKQPEDRFPAAAAFVDALQVVAPVPPPIRDAGAATQNARPVSSAALRVPLVSSFRFVNEPVPGASAALLGREQEVTQLVQRLAHSATGSFLISGYRGSGKTSLVNEVLVRLASELKDTTVVGIRLNVTQVLEPVELMHLLIRSVYETLREQGHLERLPQPVLAQLSEARQRIQFEITHKSGVARERNVGLPKVSAESGPAKMSFEGAFSIKSSTSNAIERSFLEYDDHAAEADLLDIFGQLATEHEIRASRWQRLWRQAKGAPTPKQRIKVVFVLDELDKLEVIPSTDDTPPVDPLSAMLGTLKTLLTSANASFLFVAGRDLHDRFTEDSSLGDSLYESIFSTHHYVSCLWNHADAFCASVVEGSPNENELARSFVRYLAYVGRGIPRRTQQEFYRHVQWQTDRAYLVIGPELVERVQTQARLERLIEDNSLELFGARWERHCAPNEDQVRLSMFYLLDWIFRRGSRHFTHKDCISACQLLNRRIALPADIGQARVDALLRVLTSNEFVLRDLLSDDDSTYVLAPSARTTAAPAAREDRSVLEGVTQFVALAQSKN